MAFNRFGKGNLLGQVVLSSQLDIFEKSRRAACNRFGYHEGDLARLNQDLSDLNLIPFDYILFHWHILPTRNFREFFENYICFKTIFHSKKYMF
jgi:hypothetical protein